MTRMARGDGHDALDGFETAHHRHVDVHRHDIRFEQPGLLDGLQPIFCQPDDGDSRSEPRMSASISRTIWLSSAISTRIPVMASPRMI